jgi:acyl-homoserine-lactone acylase
MNAKVLLSYGNATQRDSPHFGDQLELFSKKEMRDDWFLKSDVDKHAARIEIKVEKGFEAETKPN